MKLAILGGSFNPVHVGHLFLADAVITGLGYDRVILVPAFQSPFKINAEGASPPDRMDMLAASISADPRLSIEDCEICREGVSYTIDTLKDIIARYEPDGKPGLIMGNDLASQFSAWRSPDGIAELADIIIARRLTEPALQDFPYPYTALENDIINISSKQIREKISRGGAWRYLVPSGARYIIEQRRLYGFSGFPDYENVFLPEGADGAEERRNTPGIFESIIRIENDARSSLDMPRFIHSRNVALMAWDLCRRFGLDPQKGYLAGIAHDICKNMSVVELIRLAHADGGGLSKLEQKKTSLLHARAAAVVLRRKYGITDKDILEGVRYHTTGSRDMGPLAKVIYIADKIEVSRTDIDPVLKELSRSADLDTLFFAVLGDTVAYLRSRQMDLSYGTRRLMAAMNKRNKL